MTRRRKLAFLALANLFAALVALLAVEVAGRVFLRAWPSYEVLFLEPDRAVGWKLVPSQRFTWTGIHWYASDFSVDVETNSLGFRDRERSVAKPPDTIRVALLGDSFVEALQVPLEETAGQLLEQSLDAGSAPGSPGPRYEVLNFGVSNYGVGQYLLTWETYARPFAPDVVFAFVAGLHMARTVQRYESGAFRATAGRSLWVRPTFRLEHGELVREPAADFEEFVALQQRLLREEFAGQRIRRRESSVLAHFARAWWPAGCARDTESAAPAPRRAFSPEQTLVINLAILQELGRQVREAGAVLVIVDAAPYFNDGAPEPSAALARLCAQEGFGCVPLGDRLLAANRAGRSTQWSRDGHLNAFGNELFAEALHEWMAAHPLRAGRVGTGGAMPPSEGASGSGS